MKKNEQKQVAEWRPNRIGAGTAILLNGFFIILSVLTVLPFLFVLIVSLSSEDSIAANGYSFFPTEWSLDAYRYLLQRIDYIGHSFLLSVALTLAGTLLSLILISTMAFVLSRRDFRFRKLYTALILIPMFFSGGLAASYVVNTQIFGLKNTFFALLLPGACSSWYILVMRTYFQQNIPTEILESAQIDGASVLRIFLQFVLPLSRPVLITVGLFEAFSYWNSWYYAMLYISPEHRELFPLQYVLYNLQKNVEFMSSNENISGAVIVNLPTETFRMAVVVLIVLPILVSYPFFRKAFLRGLTAGAVKK
ncbi:MAG: carbohydrate ABC transporter permease [Flexilinea sp.]|nr:carbohydrate ABC transporter permease [Flexilinea sp.]